ncbi:MAG TPA: ATP-binding protein [Candidatus Eisenbacteria bacterium]|nr:ATP-binding protein [Candidatus Eisenbacteria bacterium]
MDAFVALFVRALDLDRLLFLIDDLPGQPMRCVGAHGPVPREPVVTGAVPPGGPWSASFPVESGGRVGGVLLLGRANDEPLDAKDYALARQLADGAGSILENAGLAADLEHARGLLQRADRLSALGTLAAGVAHEIRNPLVSVRTFIQLLPERVDDEEFRTSFRELALKEIERICELITDLLSFSRPSPADREPASLNEIASQIVRLLEPEARKRDVTITADFTDLVPIVVVHESQVKQVLMNVVLNAIQACAGHGSVTVTTQVDAAGCVIEVADTGVGMTPEQREHMFDPFFTTKDNGSGLGLYIANRIVSDHGGRIEARPREGGGTIFTITFPTDPQERHGSPA